MSRVQAPSPRRSERRQRNATRWLLLALTAMLTASLVAPTTQAQNPAYGLDDRVFPEPMMATSFLQWPDFVAGIEALDAAYPDYLEVFVIGESIEGRPIYFVEITNENSDTPRDDKLQIGYSASIHANEAAGREGMVRVIEDLAAGIGELGDLQPVLDDIIVNVWFPNPDSWASGDYFTVDPDLIFEGPPGYYRTNVAGVDLNREFPNPGLIFDDHTPMSEPESQSVVKELRYSGRHENLVTGTDLHGMIESPNMMRAIIPNQDMDFHRMNVAIRFLQDLEQRVNDNEHFSEWNTVAEALCMVPDAPGLVEDGEDTDHTHLHGADIARTPELEAAFAAVDDGDGVWTLDEARAALDRAGMAAECETSVPTPVGGAGHGKPFLWGARWDQIGYTDSGFTSDYLMLSPRSPTGGMGAVGTITEFAYSHMVPDNKYVAKLTDMHVAGVRETVRTQIEYTLLLEQPRLVSTGPIAFVENPDRVTSAGDPNAYTSETGKPFDVTDESTWFDFDQVDYDVANTDFWADLAKYSDDPVDALAPAEVTAETLAAYDHLVITDKTVDLIDAQAVRAWVEAGGDLVLTDAALKWFDLAGVTSDAAYHDTYYLGHSDLQDMDHPLVAGVNWNARQTGEAIPIGYAMNEYPQWHLRMSDFVELDGDIVGTTGGGDTAVDTPVYVEATEAPGVSLGTVRLGEGSIDFIGAALPQPTQANDHRYGLAPYAVTALTYFVFTNALDGQVEWQPRDAPFVPFYPADPLYGDRTADDDPAEVTGTTPAPGLPLVLALTVLGVALVALARRR